MNTKHQFFSWTQSNPTHGLTQPMSISDVYANTSWNGGKRKMVPYSSQQCRQGVHLRWGYRACR